MKSVNLHFLALSLVFSDAAKRREMKRAGADTVDDKFVGSHILSRLEKQISLHQRDQLQVLRYGVCVCVRVCVCVCVRACVCVHVCVYVRV